MNRNHDPLKSAKAAVMHTVSYLMCSLSPSLVSVSVDYALHC